MTADPHADGLLLTEGVPLAEARGVVILLHGRGASARDILGLGRELYAPNVAYLAPEAAGRTWYPQSFLAPIEANEPYLSSALARMGSLVKTAMDVGAAPDKIVFCGFSQGACLATEFVARFPQRYGGLIAFTGGLIGPPGSKFIYSGNLDGMPAFLGSGDPDPHVPWSRVQESGEILTGMGARVEMKRYAGRPHTISHDEVVEAKALIGDVFGESAGAR